MSATERAQAGGIAPELVGRIRKKGVKLWSQDGRLRYRAPKGAITSADLQALEENSVQIIAFLESAGRAADMELLLRPCPQKALAPLTFSQTAYWKDARLAERPGFRSLTSATRLLGPLNVTILKKSLTLVIERHEALRTHVVSLDGYPFQTINQSSSLLLRIEDFSRLEHTSREKGVLRTIEMLMLEPVDVSSDPLLAAALMKLEEQEHVLVLAIEHIVSDAFSLGILVRDLLTSYMQLSRGLSPALPPIPIQLADYAHWQARTKKLWEARHALYWSDRIANCGRLRLPDDDTATRGPTAGWGTVPVKIDRELMARLNEWSRRSRTTIVLGVFSVFAALVLRWSDAPSGIIRYQTDGRFSTKLTHTIGYLAAMLHLRVELSVDDSFADFARRCTDEYSTAYGHHDLSRLELDRPGAGFLRNCCFNWVGAVPRDEAQEQITEEMLVAVPLRFANPRLKSIDRDAEPVLLLYDSEDHIVGGIHFPLKRFSLARMERFVRHFLALLTAMLERPEARVREVALD